MPIVSVTRFRVRSLSGLKPFLEASWKSFEQAVETPGFLDGRLIGGDHGVVFWTMTLWEDEASMRVFRNTGDHKQAMIDTVTLANEMASVTWAVETPDFPSWEASYERLMRDGRFWSMPTGTKAHQERRYPKPWTFLSTTGPFARLKAKKAKSTDSA